MGEGLGGWGAHHPASGSPTARPPLRSIPSKLSCGSFLPQPPAGRTAGSCLFGQVGRQLDLPAIGKFEVARMHLAAAALDDVAGTNRKAIRETTGFGTH